MMASSAVTAAVVVGCIVAVVYVGLSVFIGSRPFFTFWKTHVAHNPTSR